MACDTLTKASEDGTLANALSAAKSGQAASSGETTLPRSPVAQHLAVARNALLEAEKAAESSAADVAAEMEQLRTLAKAEINELRENAREAKADIKATYDEVRHELHDLREQTQGAQKEFQELREAARQVKELLNMKPS